MSERVGGRLLVGVLSEALKKFGSITQYNQAQVTDWVQRRCRELERQAQAEGKPLADVVPFDPKAAQLGERDL